MAKAGISPVADPHGGRAKFEVHLPRVLGTSTLQALGWRKPNVLTLLVPVFGGASGADEYLLRLGFEYYSEWPPTATFVNPKTLRFDGDRDLYWLPRVDGDPGLAVHANYQANGSNGQLICCSLTAQFYQVLHSVQQEHVWDTERFTFGATIHRIQRALNSTFYLRHCTCLARQFNGSWTCVSDRAAWRPAVSATGRYLQRTPLCKRSWFLSSGSGGEITS